MNNLRIKKVIDEFGMYYGLKYLFLYHLQHAFYLKILSKKIVKFRYLGHDLYMRLYSRDFDFAESILVGTYINGKLKSEYEFKGSKQIVFDGILDLGANIGLAAIYFTHRYPEIKIISVEIEQENYNLLKKNTEPYHNIYCIKRAIWDSNSKLHICPSKIILECTQTPSEGGWYVRECMNDDSVDLYGITIDSLIQRFEFRHALIKMDIEGAEYKVFKGNSLPWLQKIECILIETHERLQEEEDLNVLLEASLVSTHYFRGMVGENKIYRKRRTCN